MAEASGTGTDGPAPAAPEVPSEVHYRIGSPALGHFPGRHRSTRGESGFEYRGQAPLIDAPDARRLDLHASLADPFGGWIVRVHSQRKAVPVVVVADLSASMGFVGARRKLDVVADLVASLGDSAWRNGDRFGFIGCDAQVRSDLHLPPTRVRAAAAAMATTLRGMAPTGRSAAGLADAHRHLGRQRALVFVVSDFHYPEAEVDRILTSLAGHDRVPVVVWDALEFGLPTLRGLARLADPETGRQRLVVWRASQRAAWIAARQRQRETLQQRFRAHALKPLLMEGGFDADAVTRYFHG
jgi:hypothetical protein